MDTHEPGSDLPPAEGRLFGAVRRLLTTFLAIAQTRAELLATELQEEVNRAASVLLWSFVALLFAALTVLMLAVTVLIAFWEEQRLVAAGLLTALFLAVAVGTALHARAQVRSKPRFLSATLDELKRDRTMVEKRE